MATEQDTSTPFEKDPFPDAIWDEQADNSAKLFAEAIRDEIYELDGSQIGNVSFDHEMVANTDLSRKARSILIRSNFGAVIVFPNFKKKGVASAAVLNLGVIRGMKQEGYTADYIQENGKIYGDMKPHDAKSVQMFAYYLTHKI